MKAIGRITARTENCLKNKIIAVIGYGNQGSAQAKCLRDSGLNVIIGARERGKSWKIAEEDRFSVLRIEEAAKKADVILLLTPDMEQKHIYEKYLEKNLHQGDTLYFSHGFNITFGRIKPASDINVIMLAPKATGSRLREAYLKDEGVPALLAVYQDATGNARETALCLANAMKFTKKAIFECTFDQETHANLFAEQAVTVGGVISLMKAGFDTMVEKGIPLEVAYFECVEVFKLITDMVETQGVYSMLKGISTTASYGGMTRGKKTIDSKTRKKMKLIFDDIASGKFTEEWLAEHEGGLEVFRRSLEKEAETKLEKTGNKIRPLFTK